MKRCVVCLALGYSLTVNLAMAESCPDLTGSYSCRVDEASYELMISANLNDGAIVSYSLTSTDSFHPVPISTINVDGTETEMVVGGEVATFSSYCSKNKVHAEVRAEGFYVFSSIFTTHTHAGYGILLTSGGYSKGYGEVGETLFCKQIPPLPNL